MAYRIDYTENPRYQPPAAFQWDKLRKMAVIFFLIFLLATCLWWPEGRLALQQLVLPCDREVTAEAFSDMVDQIRGGEALDEAVAAFCREIISSAELSN